MAKKVKNILPKELSTECKVVIYQWPLVMSPVITSCGHKVCHNIHDDGLTSAGEVSVIIHNLPSIIVNDKTKILKWFIISINPYIIMFLSFKP